MNGENTPINSAYKRVGARIFIHQWTQTHYAYTHNTTANTTETFVGVFFFSFPFFILGCTGGIFLSLFLYLQQQSVVVYKQKKKSKVMVRVDAAA
jgi:hypothetical protein